MVRANKYGLGRGHIVRAEQDVQDFAFDQQVVSVFPNMIERSVPDYWSMVDGIGRVAIFAFRVAVCSTIWDAHWEPWLGHLSSQSRAQSVVAVDCSRAMMQRLRLNLSAFRPNIPSVCAAVLNDAFRRCRRSELESNASVLAPETVLRCCVECRMRSHGWGVVLTEKIRFEDEELNALVRELHHDFKFDQGYSRTVHKKRHLFIM